MDKLRDYAKISKGPEAGAGARTENPPGHIAKVLDFVRASMEDRDRSFETAALKLREELRQAQETCRELQEVSAQKDVQIRDLREEAERYRRARAEAEQARQEYAGKYQELMTVVGVLHNVKRDTEEAARRELRETLRAEEDRARSEMLAGIETERGAAVRELERVKGELADLRLQKEAIELSLRREREQWMQYLDWSAQRAEAGKDPAPASPDPPVRDPPGEQEEAAIGTAARPDTSPEAPRAEKEPDAPQRPAGAEAARDQKPAGGEARKKPSKARRVWKTVGEAAFYAALLLVILAAIYIRTTSDGSPRTLAGYSGMIVLTESMQSEIPKGSLVITKAVDADTLEIGDDITYMANQTTSVTHRIVGIMENYEDTGERAFETQGIMNSTPDTQPVLAANVVGKVVFHSEALGVAASFIGDYWPVILLVLVVMFILLRVLGRILREPSEQAAKPKRAK